MRGHSYDSRNRVAERNRESVKQMNSNTHFLSLQCILDKYQHENTMLSQQVKLLMNQNKRLRSKPAIGSFEEIEFGQRTSKKQFQNSSRERSKTLSNFPKQIDSNPEFTSIQKDKFNYQIYQRQKKYLQNPKRNTYYDDKKTQRKYSYLPQSPKRQPELKSTTTCLEETNLRNIENSAHKKDLDKSKELTKQRRCQPTFTRQVYLDEETILIDDDIQKLPCFVQPSFGNIDLKISNYENVQIKKSRQSAQVQVKKMNQRLKQPIFKLGKTQNENQTSKKINFNSEEIQKISKLILSERDKENVESASCRKTNYPYIKNEFKISEPKTQLTKIFYPERIKQQKQPEQIPKNCRDKKIFLNVISKAPKKSMFAK